MIVKLWLEVLLPVSLPLKHWCQYWNSHAHTQNKLFFIAKTCVYIHYMKSCIALRSVAFIKRSRTSSSSSRDFRKKIIQINKDTFSLPGTSPVEGVPKLWFIHLLRSSARCSEHELFLFTFFMQTYIERSWYYYAFHFTYILSFNHVML